MKRAFVLTLALCLLLLCACGQGVQPAARSTGAETGGGDGTAILLQGDRAEITGGGAKAEGSTVTISAVGVYTLSGSLDGQIVVDTGEDPVNVTLRLAGAEIRNPSGPALWVRQAKNVRLELAEGSENLLAFGTEADLAAFDGSGEGAALYAEDDLQIEGGGRLQILGYGNNGITCKDDLEIQGGLLDVSAANHGIRASESLLVTEGSLHIRAGGDAMKTTSADKDGKGWMKITGGELVLEAGSDGLSAETDLSIGGGTLSVTAQGEDTDRSHHALKAKGDVTVLGGELELSSEGGDGVHCDGSFWLTGGSVRIRAADDGVQTGSKDSGLGDAQLTGGSLRISAAHQAIKAAGQLCVSCDLLALAGTDKQAAPADVGGPGVVLLGSKGSVGTEVSAEGGGTLTAAYDFKCILFSAPELKVGDRVDITVGQTETTVTAQ